MPDKAIIGRQAYGALSRRCLLVLSLLFPLVVFPLGFEPFDLPKRLLLLGGMLAIFCLQFGCLPAKLTGRGLRSTIILLLLFAGWVIFTGIFGNQTQAAAAIDKSFMVLLMVAVYAVETAKSSMFPKQLALALIAGASLQALLVLFQAMGIDMVGVTTEQGRWRCYGTLGNPNNTAWHIAGGLVLLFGCVAIRQVRLLYAAILSALLLAAILLTGSRGALFSSLITVFCLLLGGKKPGLWLLMSLVAGTAVFFCWQYPERFFDNASIHGRYLHWQTGWRLFLENPWLGVGFGGFEPAFAEHLVREQAEQMLDGDRRIFINQLHQDYLQFAIESGIIGLLLFLGLVAGVFKTGLACRLRHPWVLVYVLLMLNSLVLGLFDFPLHETVLWYLLLIAMGVVLGSTMAPLKPDSLAISSHKHIRLVKAVISVVGLTLFFYFGLAPWLADYCYAESLRLERLNRQAKMLFHNRLAVSLQPGEHRYRANLNRLRHQASEGGKALRLPTLTH